MKKLLLALFVMCSALSFSEKVIKATDIDVKGNIIYEAGQNTPYTGFIDTFDEKGVLGARTEFKNGVQDGSSKIYFPSGKLASEANFQNGKQIGIQKDYYENGKLKIETAYKNGLRNGVSKAYDENGKLVEQATFKNGKQVK